MRPASVCSIVRAMKRLGLLLLVTAAVACGDNSNECGPGTTAVDGLCTPDGSGAICGDGTSLDTTSGACVPDPTVCGDGTVLINGTCQDPTAGLTIDLEEGPEPNGVESNASLAGTIALKPIGDANGFVVHGCIKPVTDFADLDVYKIQVAGPTLIDVTADGVHGLAAGFVAFGVDPALNKYQRFGLNLANDMSHRELYFPKAGAYEFIMSDTRSLLGLVDGASNAGGDALEPAGNPDGTSCYYVTLKQEAIPAPTAVTTLDDVTGTISDKVLFYSVPLTSGYVDIAETIDSTHAAPAFAVAVSDQFRTIDDGSGSALFGGVKATDTTVIAVDNAWNYAFVPAGFTLSFPLASTAQALPTAGTTVNSTSNGTTGTFDAINLYYFDAPAAGATFGMNLASSTPLQGGILTADNTGIGSFGGFGATAQTFTTYLGLWRAPAAGRYYLAVFDAADAVGTAFTLTSTLTAIAPGAVAVGTALTAQPDNAFNSVPYTLDVNGNIWDSFNATGTNTGNVAVTLFDPTTAFGRLDAVTLATTSGPAVSPPTPTPVVAAASCPASVPKCSFNFPIAGGLKGFIVKSLPQTNLLVKVNPVAPTGAPTFGLDFATRVYTDLGAITAPHTTMDAAETVAANAAHRYYFTTTPGNLVTITVHPTVLTNNPAASTLNPDESINTAGNGAGVGVDEVISYVQDASGYSAFQVTNVLAAIPMTYDLTVDVELPFYTSHTSNTAFADACTGGTTVPFVGGDNDDGITAPQTTPTGFQFYGATNTQYVIAANGYISFNTSTDGNPYSVPLPDGVGDANIAPFWEDLGQVVACTKTTGTKTTIQWTGIYKFGGGAVQFQAILDTADDSIELVYGPGMVDDGTDWGAIGGVESTSGDQGTETGNGLTAAFGAANTAVKLTHP
ncbi:MAG: hypothetical protein ABI591_27270 [Kofleriaceae bacterium]